MHYLKLKSKRYEDLNRNDIQLNKYIQCSRKQEFSQGHAGSEVKKLRCSFLSFHGHMIPLVDMAKLFASPLNLLLNSP
ncbi:hypothetical protein SADUNF_Sadunf16G0183600 [Salix dunnii]|uniref:Uncharacterized protein n=1 Tax=Salix dunnii TaxID=1413687 RepID=A0A835J7G8_9ROSI|nr:hypothetical protein SADUNF_Sadunf16G0183600 [Salix dunnii]